VLLAAVHLASFGRLLWPCIWRFGLYRLPPNAASERIMHYSEKGRQVSIPIAPDHLTAVPAAQSPAVLQDRQFSLPASNGFPFE
jgi:hypothetical protein